VVCIYASGTYTVDLTGSATVSAVQVSDGASGTQTLKVDGASTNVDLSVGAASSVGSTGVLALSSSSAGGYSDISGAGGVTVTSGGVLSTSLTVGTSVPAYIETPVTNQAGGTESGNPVNLNDVVLADSAGTGSFDDIGSGSTLTGTIPVGQTVTVDGRVTNVSLTVTGVTDHGTLALASNSAGGYADVTGSGSGLPVASGAQLTTSLTGSGVPAYIETPLTVQAGGTVTIGAPDTRQDNTTLTTNAGTIQVLNGGHLTLSGGSTLTNTGTLRITVNGTAGTGGISGPGVTVTGSTLAVTTVGSQPTAGTMFTPISGR
jgi:hypothetical protein